MRRQDVQGLRVPVDGREIVASLACLVALGMVRLRLLLSLDLVLGKWVPRGGGQGGAGGVGKVGGRGSTSWCMGMLRMSVERRVQRRS